MAARLAAAQGKRTAVLSAKDLSHDYPGIPKWMDQVAATKVRDQPTGVVWTNVVLWNPSPRRESSTPVTSIRNQTHGNLLKMDPERPVEDIFTGPGIMFWCSLRPYFAGDAREQLNAGTTLLARPLR